MSIKLQYPIKQYCLVSQGGSQAEDHAFSFCTDWHYSKEFLDRDADRFINHPENGPDLKWYLAERITIITERYEKEQK